MAKRKTTRTAGATRSQIPGTNSPSDKDRSTTAAPATPGCEPMLQLVMDNIPQYVFWKDRNSVYQGCNRNFARAAGVGDPSGIVGRTDFDLPWRREESEFFVQCDRQVMETGQPLYQITEPQQQADGRQTWVETNKIPLRDATGTVIGVLGTYQDITERKQAQEALQQSEQRYRMLAESAEDSIFIIDRNFRVQYVNRYGATRLQREVDAVIGHDLTELFPPDIVDRFRSNLGKVFSSAKTIAIESRTVFPTGEHWLDTQLIPLLYATGEVMAVMGVSRDITERKTAEKQLQLLSSAVRQSTEGLAILDMQNQVVFSNESFAAMHGYTVEQVMGRHVSIFHTPEQMPSVNAAFDQISQVGEFSGELGHVRRDGSCFPMMMHTSLLRDETGKPMGVIGSGRDITEQKRAELALRASEASYHAIFNSVNDAILVYSIETGEILDANTRLLELSGYELDEVRQMSMARLAADSSSAQTEGTQTRMQQAAAGKPQLFEVLARHKSGRQFWVEVNLKRATISGVDRVLAVVRDIDDRKRAEDALHESSQLYRSLVEMSPDAVIVTDMQAGITMANRQAMLLHRFERVEDMIGKPAIELIAPEDRARVSQILGDTSDVGGVRCMAFNMLRCNGETFAAELSRSSVLDSQGQPRYRIHIARDVTERNKLQSQLLQSQKLESIGTLAGGIAHDFNNLLAVIIGNVSMLQRDSSLPARIKDALHDVMHASERGSALTHQLLAYARSGLQAPVPTDLNQLIESVLRILKRTAPAQIELVARLDPALPRIVADPSQIEQVLMNLVLNAIQASTPPGAIEIVTDTEILSPERAKTMEIEPGEYVRLKVSDRGCGMNAATLERIFEPFFTTKPTGRGMGLSAALGIVQSHKGYIRPQSKPGEGTTMIVHLPATRQAAEPAQKLPAKVKEMHAPRGSETILVIDDQPPVARTVEQILASLGYCVVVHTELDEAMSFLNTNAEDLDLILLDLNLPQRSGDQVMLQIHQQWPDLPVLLTSGSRVYEDLPNQAATQAAGFLAKPFSIMGIATLVRRVLDERGSTAE